MSKHRADEMQIGHRFMGSAIVSALESGYREPFGIQVPWPSTKHDARSAFWPQLRAIVTFSELPGDPNL